MSKNNKVFFILPENDTSFEISLSGVAAPTGPIYLYSYAKSINFGEYDEGQCYDLTIHNKNEIIKKFNKEDLVCLTVTLANYLNALDFIKRAKERGAIVALGGPWASVKAKQIHNKHPEIDYINIGEGEATLADILHKKVKKGIITKCPIPMTDLPGLDFSGWTTGDLNNFFDNLRERHGSTYGIGGKPSVFVFYQSARGCIQQPKCKFCGSRLGNKLVYRTGEQFYEDTKNIYEQFKHINKNVHIFDCSDSFTSSLGRFKEFHALPNLTFTVFGRTDEINPSVALSLKKLGVTKISLGIESGSEKKLKEVGKKTSIADNLNAVKNLKEVGISVYINLIYGLPGETVSDIEETLNHFIELSEVGDIYRVGARLMTPLPNAVWYFDLLKKRSDLNNDGDYIDLDKVQTAWLESMTKLTLKDIQKVHSRLTQYARQKGISFGSEKVRGIL